MTAKLPPSIQNYFQGKNVRDFAVAVSGFAPTAIVKDEGHDHKGPTAIRAWLEETSAKYHDIAEIKSVTSKEDQVEVAAEISGKFPGSPILLRFDFTLEGDRIVRLQIGP